MNARGLAVALFKVWGVFWLVSGVTSLANLLVEIITNPYASGEPAMRRFSLFSTSATTLVTLGAAVVLLTLGERIAEAVVPAGDEVSLSMPSVQLEVALLGVLGVYLLVVGLRQGAVVGYTLIRKPSWDASGTIEDVWRNLEREVAGAIVNTAAGFVLVLGRKGIAETWARLRPMVSGEGRSSDDAAG